MDQNNALIVYFSGTGGTKMIADKVKSELTLNRYDVTMFPLDLSLHNTLNIENDILEKAKYLFVLYPVYSFDAPKPIYEWIEGLSLVKRKKTIVISVSGGGDIFVNKSSRSTCIKALEEKGFDVFYEKMLVMPSNFAFSANDDLNMWLLKSMPSKVKKIVEEVISNKNNRLETKKNKKDKKSFGQKENNPLKKFGLSLYVNDVCNSCGWCANSCPRANIKMENNQPVFSDQCIMCMRCIYGCPTKAITSKKFKFATLKTGYNLNALETKMKDKELQPISKCSKGILWIGARKYLMGND